MKKINTKTLLMSSFFSFVFFVFCLNYSSFCEDLYQNTDDLSVKTKGLLRPHYNFLKLNKNSYKTRMDRLAFDSSRHASIKVGYGPIHFDSSGNADTNTGEVLFLDNFQVGVHFDIMNIFDISVKYININSKISANGQDNSFSSDGIIPIYFGFSKIGLPFNILGIPFAFGTRFKAGAVVFGQSKISIGDAQSGEIFSSIYPAFGFDLELAAYKGIGFYFSIDCLLTRYSLISGSGGDVGVLNNGPANQKIGDSDQFSPNIFVISFGVSYTIPYT